MRFEAACEAYVEAPNRDSENLLVKKGLEDITIVDADAELLAMVIFRM